MKKNRFKMKVIASGFADNFRYRIFDVRRGYWTGVEWDKEPKKSLLYYFHEDAVQAMRAIEKEEEKGQPIKKLQATVHVELIGKNTLDNNELADYLCKEARLILDHPGPEGNSVHLRIDWGTLTEVPDDNRESGPQD